MTAVLGPGGPVDALGRGRPANALGPARPEVPVGARRIAAGWQRLVGIATGRADLFDPEMTAALPEPARRWLLHTLAPGTPLWPGVELSAKGRIRLGSWRSFRSRQILSEDGFIWAARARVVGAPVLGFDRYSCGSGEMRWRLFGVVPVMTDTGPDVTRSAAGRFAAERVSLLPTAFRTVTWTPTGDENTVRATVRVAGAAEAVDLTIDADGALRRVLIERWGNPDGTGYRLCPFGVTVDREERFAGVTLMSSFRAGWWVGSARADEAEFFRCVVTAARPIGDRR